MKKYLLAVLLTGSSLLNAAPDATSHRKAAEQLLLLINPREVMLTGFNSLMGPFLERVPEGKKDAVRKAFARFGETIADSPELRERLVTIYVEAFSESELNELAAFYSTPAGKKALAKMPELFQQGASAGQEIAQKHGAAFQAELNAIMAEQ